MHRIRTLRDRWAVPAAASLILATLATAPLEAALTAAGGPPSYPASVHTLLSLAVFLLLLLLAARRWRRWTAPRAALTLMSRPTSLCPIPGTLRSPAHGEPGNGA